MTFALRSRKHKLKGNIDKIRNKCTGLNKLFITNLTPRLWNWSAMLFIYYADVKIINDNKRFGYKEKGYLY